MGWCLKGSSIEAIVGSYAYLYFFWVLFASRHPVHLLIIMISMYISFIILKNLDLYCDDPCREKSCERVLQTV